MRIWICLIIGFVFLTVPIGCRETGSRSVSTNSGFVEIQLEKATGFKILADKNSGIKIVEVTRPWPGSNKSFKYLLLPENQDYPQNLNIKIDDIINIPVQDLVITATSHVSMLDAIGEVDKIRGFPGCGFVSNKQARKRIEDGKIKELGSNENMNTEILVSLKPNLLIGFGIEGTNKAYKAATNANIPVVYNGDWAENDPLGRAEWIKFFGAFLGKEKEADQLFNHIKSRYLKTKKLAENATKKPRVFTGGLFKDVWHVSGGQSWLAYLLKDANADYLWADNTSQGSIPLSLESVLDQASNADYWLNPSYHTNYHEMQQEQPHYAKFDAFNNKKIYSHALAKGTTGGLLFYEDGPLNPDVLLMDLVNIFHPSILPKHQPVYFKELRGDEAE